MKENKKYKLSVDDYIVYEKTYYVEAKSAKEAKEKFFRGDWLDCDDSSSDSFYKSVVRAVDRERTPPTTRAGCKPMMYKDPVGVEMSQDAADH